MKIRVLGGGFYVCHIALALRSAGHNVELHEIASRVFSGASGGIPARLHQGFHYPRSRMTRAACLEHNEEFMEQYGFLTKNVPINIYAIAENHSMVDYQQYVDTLTGEVEFIEIYDPTEFGLSNVEGALLTGERHIVTDWAADYFTKQLGDTLKTGTPFKEVDSNEWDYTIDCTFCANDSAGVDRYEPCIVPLLEGPTDRAITIMDGPFHSIYPWNEDSDLVSLSSAKFTPLSKQCDTWEEANEILRGLTGKEAADRCKEMIHAMSYFYKPINDLYELETLKTSIRAMPLSGADTRLVDVVRVGDRSLRVRAGKIDAIIAAERMIKELIEG